MSEQPNARKIKLLHKYEENKTKYLPFFRKNWLKYLNGKTVLRICYIPKRFHASTIMLKADEKKHEKMNKDMNLEPH